MRRTASSVGASIFIMGLSTFESASKISGTWTLVALESTETLAVGSQRSRSSRVSAMMRGNSGFSVGSPSPEKVIESTCTPSAAI